MPELPEVTTTVKGLKGVLPKLTIVGVWSDLPVKDQKVLHYSKTIKNKKFYDYFVQEVVGSKIVDVKRRAKNILIYLDNKKVILIHMKMTGNMLYNVKSAKYVHFSLSLSNKKVLEFSDMRKFGTVKLIDQKDVESTFAHLGPEPLENNFTLNEFKKVLNKKPAGNIKTVLMNQEIISGIGNIYSDEMLWLSSIKPTRKVDKVTDPELKKLFVSMKEVLNKGIDFGGDSMSDYLRIDGTKGDFQNHHNVYRKNKERCSKKGCLGVIMRMVVNGRSAHFCNTHQI